MKETERTKIAAVIAAAGLSSRMGAFKPLMDLGGKSIIARCVDNMRKAGAEKIIVVTGFKSDELIAAPDLEGCCFVYNRDYRTNHMFDSLRLGLLELGEDWDRIIISPGDVPAVKVETVMRLLACSGDFVRPHYGECSGHPVVMKASLTGKICSYEGRGGLSGAVESLGIKAVDIECADEGAYLDTDTPEDYARALELIGGML